MARSATESLRLRDGSRIAVIGGGPAGSFFALHALNEARQRGLQIEVVIFEGRDFSRRGPVGCNKCAGILSSHLLNNLKNLQLTLPEEVIRCEIWAYVLHLAGAAVEISRPRPERRIVSVYRGAGPRLGDLPPTVSFDSWLLEEAQERGAALIQEWVTEVRTRDRPLVITKETSLQCDLVVLATGVNSRTVPLPDLDYQPPATEIMSQDELAGLGLTGDRRVHVHVGGPSDAFFVSLVPKGSVVNVSMLGHELTRDSVGKFLEMHEPGEGRPKKVRRLCGCNPRIAVSPADNFYADRFVAVGDAAVTRLYKDGVGSAFLTARQAARVALERGISEASFRQGYVPFCRDMDRDNRIGKVLFDLWGLTALNSGRLGRAWLNALAAEDHLPPMKQHCHLALWGMFTGDDSYRTIARWLVSRGALFRLTTGLVRAVLGYEDNKKSIKIASSEE